MERDSLKFSIALSLWTTHYSAVLARIVMLSKALRDQFPAVKDDLVRPIEDGD